MKVATKIRFHYVLMVALVLLVGILGHRNVTDIGAEFDQAINRTQPVVAALLDIRFQAMRLAALARGHREANQAARNLFAATENDLIGAKLADRLPEAGAWLA